jgi:hypothetical protein
MYFLILKHHMSLKSFSVRDVNASLTPWMSWTLHIEHQTVLHLLGIDLTLQQFLLNCVEQLLNGIQPRTVLSVEQNIGFHLLTCWQYLRMMMEDGIVHKKNNTLLLQLFVRANVRQHSKQEIFKQSCIVSSFYDLWAYQLWLGYSSDEWHGVDLLLGFTLLHWQFHCLEGILAQLLLKSIWRPLLQSVANYWIYTGRTNCCSYKVAIVVSELDLHWRHHWAVWLLFHFGALSWPKLKR